MKILCCFILGIIVDVVCDFYLLSPRPLWQGALNDDAHLTSVCLSCTLGLKSRTERPRKTKIGTQVAQVTRDSDTTFKV